MNANLAEKLRLYFILFGTGH